MRIAISNIAWDISEDEAIGQLLQTLDIDAIDVAPGKYFPNPLNTSDDDILRVRHKWAERGVEITGMQALLFGTTGLNVFGSPQSREAMLDHLRAVCHIGAGLGATRLVFGSPKNRDRSGLDDQQVLEVAVPFFRDLGAIAQLAGVQICLEPNPTHYGANFMTTCDETAEVVREVAHPAIKMQFDTGALALNGESPDEVLRSHSSLIGHIHISEPDLVPLGDGTAKHQEMNEAIRKYLALDVVSIETLATVDEPHLLSIKRSLDVAIKHYRADAAEVGA
ncbi:sugar phosphate isomerase/epimerase [Pseudomonas sp. GM79]|uniref:sugar phosphate isomerase/epimerase family protein n=1 Tax=Pseudomonas sp. GM79 TaxID=1144338 RepID=UPI00026F84D8|nr:sugar phosphate isomerase/epimerase family protein [Pseudomonas sp. GM79]EJN23474.1 sugar phosphate isomerase/epimerase [Pseudomonas sp. GM79]